MQGGPKTLIHLLVEIKTTPFLSGKTFGFIHHLFNAIYIITAQALKLPLIPPILPKKDSGHFPHGANFAVFGATAREQLFYSGSPWCLGTQMGWFHNMVDRIAPRDGNNSIQQSNPKTFIMNSCTMCRICLLINSCIHFMIVFPIYISCQEAISK